MSIDTGQNLVFNANFPTPGIDQPSQQFRDNFQVIKTAVENLQSVSSDAGSVVTLTSTLSSIGALTFDISYTNNALTLPINDPSLGSPIAGMIRYHTVTSCLEFFDGTAWRQTIFKDSSGAVSLTTLTVTNRLTLGYTPTQPTDATTKSYVDNAIAVINSAVSTTNFASNAAVQAVQTDLNNEKVNRLNGDTTLQNEIDTINATLANTASTANGVYSSIATLTQGLSDEANTRAAADTSQQTTINNLTGQVNNATAFVSTLGGELTQEISDRGAGDQYLYDVINSSVTSSNVTNAIAAEAAIRAQADSDNSNSITTLSNQISTEQTRAEAAEASIAGEIGNAVQITGSTMTGDLTMNDANIVVDAGALVLNSSEMIVDIGTMVLTTADLIVESGNVGVSNSTMTLTNSLFALVDHSNSTITDGSFYMTNSILNFEGGVSVQPVIISDTFVYFENTVVNLENGSSLFLTNSALYLPNSDITVDAGRYFNLNKIPNTIGAGDGAFLTIDQNNFSYARMLNTVAGIVSNGIVANGVANTNALYEFSALRIATTNDPANGVNGDSIAIEAACDLWLNPGWSGIQNATVDARVPTTSNASIYVGNAVSNTLRIERATGNVTTAGVIIINGNASNGQAPVLFTSDSSGVDTNPAANGAITPASAPPPPLLNGSYFQISGSDGAHTRMELVSHGVITTAGTKYAGRAANGTTSAPTATSANTTIVSLGAFGHNGTAWTTAVAGTIDIVSPSNWTTGSNETELLVSLTPSGSTTPATVLTIDSTGNMRSMGIVKTGVFTTATLPSAATAGAGARAFVTDSTSAPVFGSAYSGGGTHSVPVWSDGANWFIG